MNKVQATAKLKLLPPDRQEQIIEWCDTPKSETCPGGYQFAREQLAADGLQVSVRALSEFWHWYMQREMYEEAATHADLQKRLMLAFDPEAVERAEKFGDFVFLQEAVKVKDADTYTAISKLRETRKKRELKTHHDTKLLELQERRVRILEEKMAEAKEKLTALATTANKGGLTAETLRAIEEAAALL